MNRRWAVAGAVAAVVVCTAAALTTPFTPGADITVAAGFALILALPLVRRIHTTGAVTVDRTPAPDGARRWGARWAVVLGPLLAALIWELVCFAHGDRAAWPTVSSLLDDVDGSPFGRVISCAAWLGLGWALVAR